MNTKETLYRCLREMIGVDVHTHNRLWNIWPILLPHIDIERLKFFHDQQIEKKKPNKYIVLFN